MERTLSAAVFKASYFFRDFLRTGIGKAGAAALVLFLVLSMLPFHAPDLFLEDLFYEPGRGFIWRDVPFFEAVHSYGKIITAAVLLSCIFIAVRGLLSKQPARRSAAPRALWTLAAVTLCLVANSLLRAKSGVACPWDVTLYGGAEPLSTAAGNLVFGSMPVTLSNFDFVHNFLRP